MKVEAKRKIYISIRLTIYVIFEFCTVIKEIIINVDFDGKICLIYLKKSLIN